MCIAVEPNYLYQYENRERVRLANNAHLTNLSLYRHHGTRFSWIHREKIASCRVPKPIYTSTDSTDSMLWETGSHQFEEKAWQKKLYTRCVCNICHSVRAKSRWQRKFPLINSIWLKCQMDWRLNSAPPPTTTETTAPNDNGFLLICLSMSLSRRIYAGNIVWRNFFSVFICLFICVSLSMLWANSNWSSGKCKSA